MACVLLEAIRMSRAPSVDPHRVASGTPRREYRRGVPRRDAHEQTLVSGTEEVRSWFWTPASRRVNSPAVEARTFFWPSGA